MSRSIPIFIGCRYIFSRKGSRSISFTSLMSMAGLILGVFTLILVLSVFNGSQGVQRTRTLITVPHIDISLTDGDADSLAVLGDIQTVPGIKGASRYVNGQALFSMSGFHQVARFNGVNAQELRQISDLEDHMVAGSLDDLQPGSRNIILGRSLASLLRVYPGDRVNLAIPRASANGRNLSPDSQPFIVSGIFDVEFSIGSDLAYMHIEDASAVLGLDEAPNSLNIRVQVNDFRQATAIAGELDALLSQQYPESGFTVRDWSEMEASLFNALRMEKILTGFMLMMIVAIGAFNIISTLVMMVSDKRADIAILRTMGTSEKTIMGIFIVQGFMVGVFGTLCGAVAGIALTLNFDVVAALINEIVSPSDMYIIASLPTELLWSDVIVVCSSALLISFLVSLYPAWRASRIQPAEVLRYE